MRRMAPASINLALLSQTIERLHSPEKNKVEKALLLSKVGNGAGKYVHSSCLLDASG